MPRWSGSPTASCWSRYSPLLGVWPAVAAAALAFNVYVLRPRHPGWISGKLSDVAINFLLPITLVAVWEWGAWLVCAVRDRPPAPSGRRVHVAACAITAAYFALLQTVPAFAQVHRALLSVLDIPFGGRRTFHNTPDLTDLATLFAAIPAFLYLARRSAGLRARARRGSEAGELTGSRR